LWPRWLLLLGIVLMAVSLYMQRGLWGLGERIWQALRRNPPVHANPADAGDDPATERI